MIAALIALGLLLASVPTASAAVTSSQITTPSTTTFMLRGIPAPELPETLTIAGTTDSTSPGTDVVDIICVRGGTTTPRNNIRAGVTLNADGSFSTTVNATSFPRERTCRLRAIAPSAVESEFWRFGGPTVAISELNVNSPIPSGPNAGQLLNYSADIFTNRALFDLRSISNQAIDDATPLTAAFEVLSSSMNQGFSLVRSSPISPTDTASSILVNGENAYATYAAYLRGGSSDSVPGLPPLGVEVSVDPTLGPVVVETASLAACDDETQSTCPSFTALPVQIVRTYTPSADGYRIEVSDRITSTDGASHEVRLDYGVNNPVGVTTYAVNGSGVFQRYAMATGPLPFGPGPQSLISRNSDGTFFSATTWRTTPYLTLFTTATQGNYYVARYTSTATASPTTIEMALGTSTSLDALRTTTLAQEDRWLSPTIAITAPTDGAIVAGSSAVIMGTSTGPRVLGAMRAPTVTVNGVIAEVGEDGRWSAEVPLDRGANTVTATATNSAGLQATATRTVTQTAAFAGPVAARRLTAVVNAKGRNQARAGARAIVVRGRLDLPAGIRGADGCTGMVRVTVRVGSRHVATRWAELRPSCRYAIRTPLPRRGVATISTRFTGNPYVLARNARAVTVATRR